MKASAAAGAGTIVSVNTSRKKGQVKTPVPSAELVAGQGIKGDAHLGFAHRQVSLLMIEDIKGRAFGSPLARGLYSRASTAEVDPRVKPGAGLPSPGLTKTGAPVAVEEQKSRLAAGSFVPLGPGAFAENLTTRGIDLGALKVGDELLVGDGIRLRVSQIGKECHTKCAVFHLTGDCIMPVRGIFCEVLAGGTVRAGDTIEKR